MSTNKQVIAVSFFIAVFLPSTGSSVSRALDVTQLMAVGIPQYTKLDGRRSWHEHCGAFEPARAEIGEGLISLVERILRGFGNDADLRRQA